MKILPNAGFNKLTGFVQNVDFGNPALIARLKKAHPETLRSCKPMKVDCEFCKEKLGLLNSDIFVKENKAAK